MKFSVVVPELNRIAAAQALSNWCSTISSRVRPPTSPPPISFPSRVRRAGAPSVVLLLPRHPGIGDWTVTVGMS
uniref:Uncharacterized protein n=1 Tax=Leersia perrieri TaxID=77586 RepID=A0A0D9VRN9_9ORYZ